MAQSSAQEVEVKKEIEFLSQAKSLFPNNPVVLFKLAVAFEAEGEVKEALKYYEEVIENKLIDSTNFNEFVRKQIDRVKEKGPSTKPPHPGIKYMLSGI